MLVHGIASLFIFAGAAGARKPAPPTYKVRLIAAPAPTDEERKAPEAVERPAEEKPAPVPTKKPPPKSTAAKEAPPKTADDTKREAELSFLVHRDGSVSDLQFIKRSGNFAFDLEAQGAVEEAGRFKAFGALPDGWTPDVLFVRFYFSGKRS